MLVCVMLMSIYTHTLMRLTEHTDLHVSSVFDNKLQKTFLSSCSVTVLMDGHPGVKSIWYSDFMMGGTQRRKYMFFI